MYPWDFCKARKIAEVDNPLYVMLGEDFGVGHFPPRDRQFAVSVVNDNLREGHDSISSSRFSVIGLPKPVDGEWDMSLEGRGTSVEESQRKVELVLSGGSEAKEAEDEQSGLHMWRRNNI
jgi:hypothetical protein